MHVEERDSLILDLMGKTGFVSFKSLEATVPASPATLRRDLDRLEGKGVIQRVRGGARLVGDEGERTDVQSLAGVPFHENIDRNRKQKEAIGRAAATLCQPGESIIIDGGSTTLQMCRHLAGLNLQVLTNSLHVVSALLPQPGTRIAVPGGSVFREQNIILGIGGEECMPRVHAPRLFMGAAFVGAQGVMQADVVLAAAERQMIDRAEWVALLVDSSKFAAPSGSVVCGLDELDVIVTDAAIGDAHARMIEQAGVKLIIA
ncbi:MULTISPECIES: DeoR/GlpR family DNA-binding transcription regulator [Sphingomonas]|uniref:DeoR family ulaG and ulaABCDEF operon transcriptional repressor n=1 Tax=Sphingomonas leidyi TaxID=68569 RepID=A0A7X5ZWH4_9SPHN|nr:MULTISPECIES: DeoR/GlpR family DNA-binding transcription regulator [Sphingomonas]MBN8813292.1 DeoR/GlpR transcriptional regulator [Sphingomonas sp.]NIJ66222.1 DeoR family ulaG and ulaABCDEF operon transcriptional repressor [Sphingomonas leidyi]OJY53313.1 MAG: DeoR family transcriptional regulator [Sphingomonas sp. 67-41]